MIMFAVRNIRYILMLIPVIALVGFVYMFASQQGKIETLIQENENLTDVVTEYEIQTQDLNRAFEYQQDITQDYNLSIEQSELQYNESVTRRNSTSNVGKDRETIEREANEDMQSVIDRLNSSFTY